MSTFDYDPDELPRCRNCGQMEGKHVWVCDGCGWSVLIGADGLPLLHDGCTAPHPITKETCEAGATLHCPLG